MNKLNYTTRFINMNFRIKVYGVDNNGQRINKLVGVTGILKLIGATLFNKCITKAMQRGFDKFVCKLRRGLQVSLYAK